MSFEKIEREIEWLESANPFDHPETCVMESQTAMSHSLLLDVARAAEKVSDPQSVTRWELLDEALTALKEHCD